MAPLPRPRVASRLLVLSGACLVACAGSAPPASAPSPPPPSTVAVVAAPVQHPFAATTGETTRLIDVAIDARAAALMDCVDAARPRRRNPHDKVLLEVALDQEGHLLGVKAPAGTPPDPQLNACAQGVLTGASFPKSNSGVVTVVKTFQEQAFNR